MKKIEKSFYSLRGLGCKPAALHPNSISFLFKQFCHSMAKFGLDNLFLTLTELKSLNIKQSMLIKIRIGIRFRFSQNQILMLQKQDLFLN